MLQPDDTDSNSLPKQHYRWVHKAHHKSFGFADERNYHVSSQLFGILIQNFIPLFSKTFYI